MKGKHYIKKTYGKINKSAGYVNVRIKKLNWKQWLTILLTIAAATIAIILLTKEEPAEPVLPIVQAETVVTKDVEIYGEYVGRIRAQQFVEIRARVEGYLESMLFAEGTYINKGQVLFVIDPRQYKATVDKANAQLNKNKAMAQKAERDLKRIRSLHEQNTVSQLDLDNAIAAYESAKAEVQMSKADLAQD